MHCARGGGGGRRIQHYSQSKDYTEVPCNTKPASKAKSKIDPEEPFEERVLTCRDVKLIMPTILILLFTIFILVTVIPYAFINAINQLHAVQAAEDAEAKLNITLTDELIPQ